MIQKIIIHVSNQNKVEDCMIGIRHDAVNDLCTVGGNNMHSSIMSSYITDYFHDYEYYPEKLKWEWLSCGTNKIKLMWKCGLVTFNHGIETVQSSGTHFKRVTTFGRIMR